MARPKKNNADYFPHDADMRNDPKIRALRRTHGLQGYAIWNMFLEVLTDADYFEYQWTALNIELLAGDFDVEPDLLEEVINYCTLTLELLEMDGKTIYCPNLIKRFETLLNRRLDDRNRKAEEFSTRKTQHKEVIHTENPQSKVKESKVNTLSEYGEKEFLEDWSTCRQKIKGVPTNIKGLQMNELNNFNQAKKHFDRGEFQEAMQGLFRQEKINFTAMILRPTHFLERVELYLNAYRSKDFKLYGAKPIEH